MKISICIPAYGRQLQLNLLLESIWVAMDCADKLWDDIEVIVSDNATEPPLTISSAKNKKGIQIRLIKQSQNIGPARNFIEVVREATGDICWWMGSDDKLTPDSLSIIHQEVLEYSDVDLWVHDRMDWYPKTGLQIRRRWYSQNLEKVKYRLSDTEQFTQFIDSSRGLGGLFSFLGSLVFRRSRISIDLIPPIIFETAYPHVFVLFRANPCVLTGIPPIVLCRLGDDSFAQSSSIRRVLLDINGYTTVFKYINASSAMFERIKKIIVKEIVNFYFTSIVATTMIILTSNVEDRKIFRSWAYTIDDIPNWIKLILLVPDNIYAFLEWLRHLYLAGKQRNRQYRASLLIK